MIRVVYCWIDDKGVHQREVSNVQPTFKKIEEFMKMPVVNWADDAPGKLAATYYTRQPRSTEFKKILGSAGAIMIAWGWNPVNKKWVRHRDGLHFGTTGDRFIVYTGFKLKETKRF